MIDVGPTASSSAGSSSILPSRRRCPEAAEHEPAGRGAVVDPGLDHRRAPRDDRARTRARGPRWRRCAPRRGRSGSRPSRRAARARGARGARPPRPGAAGSRGARSRRAPAPGGELPHRAPAHRAGAPVAPQAEAVRVDRVGDQRVRRQRRHVVALLEEVRSEDSADAAAADDQDAGRGGSTRLDGRGVLFVRGEGHGPQYNGSRAARNLPQLRPPRPARGPRPGPVGRCTPA